MKLYKNLKICVLLSGDGGKLNKVVLPLIRHCRIFNNKLGLQDVTDSSEAVRLF